MHDPDAAPVNTAQTVQRPAAQLVGSGRVGSLLQPDQRL